MKHITEDSIDRKDSKNNIEHYLKIYTENKLTKQKRRICFQSMPESGIS